MSGFEFDPRKSASNKAKHGIDFFEAQALWRGRVREMVAESRPREMRYLNIGKIGDKYWTAVITYRVNARRIISAYPSSKLQIEFYERVRRALE